MGATGLPVKPLLPILGKPTLAYLIERLKLIKRLNEIVLATTSHSRDDRVAELSNQLNVGCFRGSEGDVLGRVLGATQAYQVDIILENTGDCILLDLEITQHCIDEYFSNKVGYRSSKNYVGGIKPLPFQHPL